MVEPSVAPRPGSSLFSPPAPPQQLEGRRAALSDEEKRFVETWRQCNSAAAQFMETSLIRDENKLFHAKSRFTEAADNLARSLIARAEGGLNK